jgi:hypothetical protein
MGKTWLGAHLEGLQKDTRSIGETDMSSSKPSGTATTVVNKDPWASQQPYLQTGFGKAQEFLDKPVGYYPGSTVVPFSPQTEQALTGMETRAQAGSPLLQQAQGLMGGTLAGDYLSAEANPYLQSAMAAATRPMTEAFSQDIMPKIQGAFSGAGRYGSGLQAQAQQRAADNLTRSIGDVTSELAFRNLADERARQQEAARLGPALGELDYADLERLGGIGGIREKQAGAQLQEDIDRYTQEQVAPRDALREFMATIGGGQYGGTETRSQPIYSDPWATGLGYAGTGANILSGLFGGAPGQSAWSGLKGLLP